MTLFVSVLPESIPVRVYVFNQEMIPMAKQIQYISLPPVLFAWTGICSTVRTCHV